jgi:hypothetical protein
MRSIFGIAPLVIGSLVGCLAAPWRRPPHPWRRHSPKPGRASRLPWRKASVSAPSAPSQLPPIGGPAPGSLELGLRSDRFNRNQGASEVDVGVAIPLWLPGERSGAQALAAAAEGALAGRQGALRLQLAQALRDAWWQWQLSQNEALLANGREARPGACATMSPAAIRPATWLAPTSTRPKGHWPRPGRRRPKPGPARRRPVTAWKT